MTAAASVQTEQADLVVVGGGPAGSTIASFVAMQGHRVVLLEKEHFPRYAVGESLLPGTVHGVCRLLGVTEELEAAKFPVKRGGTFRWGANPEPWNFNFQLSPSFPAPSSTAYQVERMKFDEILLRNAQRLGVDVREGVTVKKVTEDGDRVTGVRYKDADGVEHVVESTYLADASGNGSRINRHVGGERHYSDFFRNIAMWGYYEGGVRLPEPRAGNAVFEAFDEGWAWYIPLTDTLTSVGIVITREHADQLQGDQDAAMAGLIDRCPIIQDYLKDASRVTEGDYGKIRTCQDYSYNHDRFYRPGMVLVGDSACFIDPVFSTGVHMATYGALLAARSVNTALAGTLSEEAVFTEYDRRYRREYGAFYEFLSSFYDMQVNEDSYFWSAKKVTNMASTDVEAFATLVAGGHSGEAALLDAEGFVGKFQDSTKTLTEAVDRTSSMQADGDGRMFPLFNTQLVRGIMSGSNQELTREALGERMAEEALFDDGLVASADVLHWKVPEARSGSTRDGEPQAVAR